MVVTRWNPAAFHNEGYDRRFLWIDLVNSRYPDGFGAVDDYLDDAGWRTTFFRAWDLKPPARSSFPVDSLKELRAELRAAADSITRSQSLTPALIRSINEALGQTVMRLIEGAGQSYRLVIRPLQRDWKWIEAQIAASFGEFLTSGQTHRLKTCENPLCRWIFFDETKGNTKRWCDDRRCGNRDKVRRHRMRRRRTSD
jgi:predicted RNA-binding Zn ribbon-like protein